MRIAALTGLLLLNLVSAASADIDVKPQYDQDEPIRATVTVTGVPEGAKLRGSFSISDGSYLPTGIENVYDCWAGEGKHSIAAQGVWVLTKDVTVEGQTFPVLLDFGQFRYEKTITVGGEVPPVPPPTPGQRWAIIWEETSRRTPAQAALYLQLRKAWEANKLFVLDVSQLPPKWEAWKKAIPANQALPALMVLAGDKVVRVVPCPSSVDAVKQEVAR